MKNLNKSRKASEIPETDGELVMFRFLYSGHIFNMLLNVLMMGMGFGMFNSASVKYFEVQLKNDSCQATGMGVMMILEGCFSTIMFLIGLAFLIVNVVHFNEVFKEVKWTVDETKKRNTTSNDRLRLTCAIITPVMNLLFLAVHGLMAVISSIFGFSASCQDEAFYPQNVGFLVSLWCGIGAVVIGVSILHIYKFWNEQFVLRFYHEEPKKVVLE